MQFAFRTALVVAGLALLLVPPSVSQDQCNLPTDQDVTEVVKAIYTTILPEGTSPPTVEELFQVHFTCLATVALDMYSYATVVANFTTTESNESTVEQFQLRCYSGGIWGASASSLFKDQANLPAMPFAIKQQDQCFQCEELSPPLPNYDSDSNCLFCADECLGVGGGFCTGDTAGDCCPFFNNETGDCVDNCTTIDLKFGPDENFICVCIPCDPGYTQNSTDCSCKLTDGCEAAGQPCQNGETCVNNLSAPAGGPYYNCTCDNGFYGQNCAMPSSTMATITTTTATLTTPSEDSGTPAWIIIVPVVLFVAIATILFVVLIVIILYQRSQRSMKHTLTEDIYPTEVGYISKNPDIDGTLKEID